MRVGDIVVSICGHDMGEWYIVCEVCNEFVYLIDGKLKPIIKPKKKKLKQLFFCLYRESLQLLEMLFEMQF